MPQQQSKLKTIYFEVAVDIPNLSNDYVEEVRGMVYEVVDVAMSRVSAGYGVAWSIKDEDEEA